MGRTARTDGPGRSGAPLPRRAHARLTTGLVLLAAACATPASAWAQFHDPFDGVKLDPQGARGWRFATGDGEARMSLRPGGKGYASLRVDATRDRRGIWWALIEREVSDRMDLGRLGGSGREVRIEARLRVSHAPRRVNLQVLTQRTTDYHAHLMEFDLPEAGVWQTISMTTRGFQARPDDRLIGHLALMDWGFERYQVDLDHLKVDIVDPASAPPDQGAAVPYHPPIADPKGFTTALPVAHDSMIDRDNPDVNLNDWSLGAGAAAVRVLTVDGTRDVILRWDLARLRGQEGRRPRPARADHPLRPAQARAGEGLRPPAPGRDPRRRPPLGSANRHRRQPPRAATPSPRSSTRR